MTNPTVDEGKPSVASAPDGHLFVAVDELGTGRILIYHSTDNGFSWSWLISFVHGSHSRNPALAYIENYGQKWLVFVYELVTSDSSRSLQAIRVDPDDTSNWSSTTIDGGIVWTTPANELHPQITTDFPDFTGGVYFYVTYAKPSIDYYPVFFARSTDQAETWSTPENITGGSENTGLESRPEIAYCANNDDVYVAFSKPGWTGSVWAPQIWVTSNVNYGATGAWGTPVQVTTSDRNDSDPAIAAAWDSNTIVVLNTTDYGAPDNDVQVSYSTDGGANWDWWGSMPGWTYEGESHVDVAASHVASGRFHAVYRHNLPNPDGGDVWYSWANFDSPTAWSNPVDVDQGSTVSGYDYYPRPAIGINPSLPPANEAAIAWTSYAGPFYDVYFDSPSLIFADGFESGDQSEWSSVVP
ncbi:MAG: glycoside hydrolase [Acidobacteria bacterium]|nr:glycoside hydrolase [Acidobacteriota bacterium]